MDCSRIITTEWLKEQAACGEQVVIFEKEWPNGAEVTKENVLRALALGLNLTWFVDVAIKSYPGWARWGQTARHLTHDFEKADVFMEVWEDE